MRNRLIQLDAMRGLAALMVVGFHYTTRYEILYGHPGHLPFEFSVGQYGVELFFIISGFVIFMTLERTEDFRDFLVSRFARLYPAYWASVFLTYIFVSIARLPGRRTTFSVALINLSMLQEWFRVPHVDGVYWTLTLELSFYAIMLSLFFFRFLNKINLVAVVWLSMMVIVHIIEGETVFRLPDEIKTSLILDYANTFLAGIVFYKLYRFDNKVRALWILAACLVVEFIIHGWESGLLCSLFFIMFYGVVILKITLLNRLLSAKPLVYLGTISYSLYLLHQNIGYVVLRALYAKHLVPVAAIAVSCAVSILLASFINIIVEVPARAAIRSLWKKRKAHSN